MHNATPIIPSGAFSYPVETPNDTRWFAFLLLPEFTMLAFGAALDPLRIANQLAQKPLYGWTLLSTDGLAVQSSAGVPVSVHGPLDDLPVSTQLVICSGNNGFQAADDRTLDQIRHHVRHGGAVSGICTGATTLARAGLLTNRRFTLHWENQPGFEEHFPDLSPERSRFEQDGPISTSGGGVAASELMLSFIEHDYGADFALHVADMCLNDPAASNRRMQRSSIARALATRNAKIVAAVRLMHDNIADPLSLADIADQSGISRRHMERLFLNHLQDTPSTIYRNIRLDRARSLLLETELPVLEVAVATGFNTEGAFRKNFRNRFGLSPSGARKTT